MTELLRLFNKLWSIWVLENRNKGYDWRRSSIPGTERTSDENVSSSNMLLNKCGPSRYSTKASYEREEHTLDSRKKSRHLIISINKLKKRVCTLCKFSSASCFCRTSSASCFWLSSWFLFSMSSWYLLDAFSFCMHRHKWFTSKHFTQKKSHKKYSFNIGFMLLCHNLQAPGESICCPRLSSLEKKQQ